MDRHRERTVVPLQRSDKPNPRAAMRLARRKLAVRSMSIHDPRAPPSARVISSDSEPSKQ
ncbi:hypothetical protein L6R52_04580 [Myxococcota bacterium]|nr:hypothetical protein [Myxococcota bacterium]